MFGWEFPPHISGGLGTACYGLTKSLSALDNIEILFVVPKLYGGEDKKAAQLIGAENINAGRFIDDEDSIIRKISGEKYLEEQNIGGRKEITLNKVDFIEVKSKLQPYLSPEQYEEFLREKRLDTENIFTDDKGRLYTLKDGKPVLLEERLNKTSKLVSKDGKFIFTGKYGKTLMQEVDNYAKVASIIAEQYEFDIIHAHDWLTYAAGAAAKEVSGKPLVIHVHATEFDRSGEQNINSHVFGLEQYGMHMADKIITVSDLTGNIVEKKYGIPRNKIVTVHNAVEPQESENKVFEKNTDEKIVTFLGRITYQKGPEYFIRTAKLVLDKTDNVRFVMAGSGDMLRRMIRYAARLKISDKFHFTDFLRGEDVTRMYAISDVYVMPSISEPFGISPLEAMRSNVPVIISKQSGVSEILKNAIKVNFWDDHAMADAIYGLLNYKGMSQMLRRLSKPEAESIRWVTPAQKVKDIYVNLLKHQ
jgi:glycosyltransferase involved in cell wall biosynthesis